MDGRLKRKNKNENVHINTRYEKMTAEKITETIISNETIATKIEMHKELLSFWDPEDKTHYNQYTPDKQRCPCSVRWENLTSCDANTIFGVHGFRFE